MLKCKDIVARSSDYLEGDLSGWQRINYKMHLMMCTHCRRYLRHVQVAVAAASRVARRSVDGDRAARLSEKIRAQADTPTTNPKD